MARYVVNQLWNGLGSHHDKFLITKVSVDSDEAGIELGCLIESRGGPKSRFVFVGQAVNVRPFNESFHQNSDGEYDDRKVMELLGKKFGEEPNV